MVDCFKSLSPATSQDQKLSDKNPSPASERSAHDKASTGRPQATAENISSSYIVTVSMEPSGNVGISGSQPVTVRECESACVVTAQPVYRGAYGRDALRIAHSTRSLPAATHPDPTTPGPTTPDPTFYPKRPRTPDSSSPREDPDQQPGSYPPPEGYQQPPPGYPPPGYPPPGYPPPGAPYGFIPVPMPGYFGSPPPAPSPPRPLSPHMPPPEDEPKDCKWCMNQLLKCIFCVLDCICPPRELWAPRRRRRGNVNINTVTYGY